MRWFTADLHLGHANIIRYCQRPFASVGQMNAALMANWITAVDSSDEVWVLGDVAMGRISETLPLIAKLPGRKHLVPGNHDRCWPGHHRLRPQDTQMYEDVGFEIHPGTVELTLGGRSVVACHFPIRGDSHDTDRFAEHRPQLGRRAWLLHGHVHEKWRTNGRAAQRRRRRLGLPARLRGIPPRRDRARWSADWRVNSGGRELPRVRRCRALGSCFRA